MKLPSHGLSPLARGTHGGDSCQLLHWRFIPAGAGNTSLVQLAVSSRSVYPRWRGEHLDNLVDNLTVPGLSPLARGTLYSPALAGYGFRFIPAGAGNTLMTFAVKSLTTVYPRWRGEHTGTGWIQGKRVGLSPLARGTHALIAEFPGDHRFIPAGAGNTFLSGVFLLPFPVYPRWRGEHSSVPERVTDHID